MSVVQGLPADCLTLLSGSSGGVLQNWRSLVGVEHCDRIKRLQRISAFLPPEEQPIFYDGSILAEYLPRDVGIDIPILRVVFPERVFFDTASATLKPAAREIAEIIAQSLRHEPPDVVMFVAGHADARADRGYNLALSVDRANALAEAVLDLGVNVASVWRVGFGEDLPLVAGDSEWAYGQNRRIEFLFAARPEALAAWLVNQAVPEGCRGRTRQETVQCRRTHRPGVYELQKVERRPIRHVELRPGRRPGANIAPPSAPGGQVSPPTAPGNISSPIGATSGHRIDPIRGRTFQLDLRSRN